MDSTFWRDCPLVEVVPGKLDGQPVIKGARVLADAVVECAELGETPEETAYNYSLPLETVRQLLAYAARQESLISDRY